MEVQVEGGSGVGVQYRCSCGISAPLARLYWCRHCIALRCARCVLQEIDSYYSSDCMDEFMPSNEAKLNRGRDNRTYACPLCETSCVLVPVADFVPKAESDERYFLLCPHCQWDSSGVGVHGTQKEISAAVDKLEATPASERMSMLLKHYQQTATEELRALERKRQYDANAAYRKSRTFKRFTFVRPTKPLTDRESKQRIRDRLNKRFDTARNEWVEVDRFEDERKSLSSRARSDWAPPSAELYAVEDLSEVSTLSQRLLALDLQTRNIRDLRPLRKPLLAKRSKRCKTCQHNLVKPELNPSSNKFKLHLFALAHAPAITIAAIPHLKLNEAGKLVIRVNNPLDTDIDFRLYNEVPAAVRREAELRAGEASTKWVEVGECTTVSAHPVPAARSAPAALPLGSVLSPSGSVVGLASMALEGNVGRDEAARVPAAYTGNCEVRLPDMPIHLPAHNPVHELGLTDERAAKIEGDPEAVVGRDGSSALVTITVTPKKPAGAHDSGFVLAPLILSYEYVLSGAPVRPAGAAPGSPAASAGDKPIARASHTVCLAVLLNLGKLQ